MKALLLEKEREIDISTNKLAQNIRDRIDRNLLKYKTMEELRIASQKEGLNNVSKARS